MKVEKILNYYFSRKSRMYIYIILIILCLWKCQVIFLSLHICQWLTANWVRYKYWQCKSSLFVGWIILKKTKEFYFWMFLFPAGEPGPQPRHMRWLGIEPMTFQFAGWHSTHWATSARAAMYLFIRQGRPIEQKMSILVFLFYWRHEQMLEKINIRNPWFFCNINCILWKNSVTVKSIGFPSLTLGMTLTLLTQISSLD